MILKTHSSFLGWSTAGKGSNFWRSSCQWGRFAFWHTRQTLHRPCECCFWWWWESFSLWICSRWPASLILLFRSCEHQSTAGPFWYSLCNSFWWGPSVPIQSITSTVPIVWVFDRSLWPGCWTPDSRQPFWLHLSCWTAGSSKNQRFVRFRPAFRSRRTCSFPSDSGWDKWGARSPPRWTLLPWWWGDFTSGLKTREGQFRRWKRKNHQGCRT